MPVRGRWTAISRVTLIALAGLAATVMATPAAQGAPAPEPGLWMTIDAGRPLAPTVTLTNHTGLACQVVPNALGTVGLTSVLLDGRQVTPIATDPNFPDGLDVVLAAQLITLEPGASTTFPLGVLPAGPTGHAVETVTWGVRGSFGAVYPITTGHWRATATYAVPVTPKAGPPVCAPTATNAAAATTDQTAWVRWVALAAAVVVIVAVVVLLLWRRRRGRTAAGAVAASLLLLVAVALVVVAPAAPANAVIVVDPSLRGAYAGCQKKFFGPGLLDTNDPAGILKWLTGSTTKITIEPALHLDNHELMVGGHPEVRWDPTDHHEYKGGEGSSEPCGALYHELFHAYQDAHGGVDVNDCYDSAGNDSGLTVKEVLATRWENLFRLDEGLPVRTEYDGLALPTGPCVENKQDVPDICRAVPQAPDRPVGPASADVPTVRRAEASDCADDNGDPHLTTFDGLRYGFQAAGEFVATRDPVDPGYQIQVRQQAFPASRTVAVNTAIAMAVAGDRVEVDLAAGAMHLLVNGKPAPLAAVALVHGGGIGYDAAAVRPTLDVTWPDGSAAQVSVIGAWGLHLTAHAAAPHASRLAGLLGDFNHAPGDDLRTLAGRPLPAMPAFTQLYPSFADSWRITDATSLFTYPSGQHTAAYTDRTFPHQPPVTPPSTAAAALCQRLGVTDPVTLADCTLDVAETGQAAFAEADRQTQTVLGTGTGPVQPIPSPGGTGPATGLGTSPEATLTVTAPDGTGRLTFAGTAGQRVFVDILSATVPAGCGQLDLVDPTGRTIEIGCIDADGTGSIGGELLTSTGTYALVFAPAAGKTGTVHVRLTYSTDIHGVLPADGSPVTSTIAASGQVASYTFAGTAGDRVFIAVDDASLTDECGVPALVDPSGGGMALGCVVNGSGFIDGTPLTTTGEYSVVIDPPTRITGQLTLRLITSHDVHGSTIVGGAAVPVTITAPGQTGRVTFAGTQGQKISVTGTGSTFPVGCGLPDLLSPTGGEIAFGCSYANGTAILPSIALPSTGTYTIEVNPSDRTTGTITLSVHAG